MNKKPLKQLEKMQKELSGLLIKAVADRMPKKPSEKLGILFSGGVDSTLIAGICKQLGVDFTCYTAAVDEKDTGFEEAEDIVWAKKAAKKLGFKLTVKKISLKQSEENLKKLMNIIPNPNVVKAGVGLTFFTALEEAKKDRVNVIFSGLGSEEIFAGYERHLKAKDVNKECAAGLKEIHERDISRDEAIAKYFKMKLELPFLDNELVKYALRIPGRYKLSKDNNKLILRQAAEQLGVPEEFAYRKKKAAQYGSKFDRAILKLAKKAGFKLKAGYISSLIQKKNKERIAALFSGGKDSTYALYLMKKNGYEISCLITMKSKNPDSYMFHTPNIDITSMQAEAMDIPLVTGYTKGEKEKELKDLENTIKKAKEKFGFTGIVTGALFSRYQKERVEKICNKLSLKCFSPLWHMSQEELMQKLIEEKFKVVISAVAGLGLSEKWLGKKIDSELLKKFKLLNEKYKINIAGEGGEFESLVLGCPLFREKIRIVKKKVIEDDEHTARMAVEKAEMEGRTYFLYPNNLL